MQKIITTFLLAVALSFEVCASDYGTVGLIDTPTARMRPDATFTSTAAIQSRSSSYGITYQILPWLEGTFRYTGMNDFFLYDRNYELKAKLIDESEYLPEVAFGIRDLVGTGVFGAEYLVANKQLGNFDLSLGLGWGRLAGDGVVTNPFKLLSDRFDKRDLLNSYNQGGTFSGNQFFQGDKVGFFGGFSYQFEQWPIKAIVEYNPDNYDYDVYYGAPKPESQVSMGLQWQPFKNISVTLSRQNNQEWGLNVQSSLSTSSATAEYRPAPFISSLDISQSELPSGIRKYRWYDTMLFDIERSGALIMSASIDDSTGVAEIVIGNKQYASWPQLIDRVHAIALMQLPDNVTTIDYIIEEQGHYVQTIRMPRRILNVIKTDVSFAEDARILPGKLPKPPQLFTNFVKKKIIFDVELGNQLMLFDPYNPLGYQFYAKIGTRIELPKRWQLIASYAQDIVNNFDEFTRVSNSVLPHVRSDAVEYLRNGQSGIEQFYLDKRGTLVSNIHYRVFGGILENMYSGVGFDALYQPFQSRLAFGLSGNYVQQREFDRSFRHRDYKTSTAFASVYWATPFYNYDVALHAGRYLAKDIGATLEVRRTFDNGWSLGLWATITDVPFETFGEGSFDKGIFLKIPIGAFGSSGKAHYATRIRPIMRDGGARIEGFSGELWWDLRDARYDVFERALMQ